VNTNQLLISIPQSGELQQVEPNKGACQGKAQGHNEIEGLAHHLTTTR
jgi:hypothetical protein